MTVKVVLNVEVKKFAYLDTSSSSSEECDCKRHPRQHKRRCETSEKKLEAPTTTESPITCEKSSIDLAFLLDASGSVGIDNFNKTLSALISTVQNISVGPNDNVRKITVDQTYQWCSQGTGTPFLKN